VISGVICLIYHDYIIWRVERLPFINRFFRASVRDQISKYGAVARSRLAQKFAAKGLHYPPDKATFIAIKITNELFVYAAEPNATYQYICTYPILGASGHLGPKLTEGDLQVPEGIYSLKLEPNTPYHLALRLNYPNQSDLARARLDGRANPGSDILVHGTNGSVGCIAVGDEASEDLFVLANDTQTQTVPLIVAPVDFRDGKPVGPSVGSPAAPAPAWLPELYKEIKNAMSVFPKPN